MNHSPTLTESQPKAAKANTPFFSPVVQKKMSVGAANDSYEVEADYVADSVMRIPDSGTQNFSHTGSLVQRKCAHCEEEEKIQKKSLGESITPFIQKSSLQSGSESHVPSHVENQINNSRGGGSIMDHGTKNFMESRFGTDFSEVRIHTGSQAVQMSRELNAQAFTVGNDVFFNEGKYSPNSDSGKHLLAHELTHTVQQGVRIGRKVQRFVTCESSESCPTREVGESSRSSNNRIAIDMITTNTLVFSKFDIGSDSMDNPWALPNIRSIINDWATEPNQSFDIKGYTDCGGGEVKNTELRDRRANTLFNFLPANIQGQVNYIGGAPLTECLSTNQTEFGRSVNRAVTLKKTTINMSTETITAKLCGPNITIWLIDQMNSNMNHPVIRTSREVQWPNYIPFFNLGWNYGFLSDFRDLVRAGGIWDFKSRQGRRGTGAWRTNPNRPCPSLPCDQTVTMCGMCFNYDVPGNIHYGWVGVAAGLGPWFLHNRADAAQAGGIDDPKDAVAIDIGIRMYQKGTALCDELTTHQHELNLNRTDECTICS